MASINPTGITEATVRIKGNVQKSTKNKVPNADVLKGSIYGAHTKAPECLPARKVRITKAPGHIPTPKVGVTKAPART